MKRLFCFLTILALVACASTASARSGRISRADHDTGADWDKSGVSNQIIVHDGTDFGPVGGGSARDALELGKLDDVQFQSVKLGTSAIAGALTLGTGDQTMIESAVNAGDIKAWSSFAPAGYRYPFYWDVSTVNPVVGVWTTFPNPVFSGLDVQGLGSFTSGVSTPAATIWKAASGESIFVIGTDLYFSDSAGVDKKLN